MKTEGLSEREAWLALIDEKCIRSAGNMTTQIYRNLLVRWDNNSWDPVVDIGTAPYRIVPDPSKPLLKVDEVEEVTRCIDSAKRHINNLPANVYTPALNYLLSGIIALNSKLNKLTTPLSK